MKLLTLFVLLCSHLPLFWPCVSAVRRKTLPRSINLVALSCLLYFDLEIAFETFGGTYSNPYFKSFFSASESQLVIAVCALVFGPWAVAAGYYVIAAVPFRTRSMMPRLRIERLFYFVSLIVCSALAAFSVMKVLASPAIWETRAAIGESLGPLVILLYIPIGVLAFYVRQSESRTRKGKWFTAILLLLSMLSTACLGERTLVLLPILIVAVFYGRISSSRILFSVAAVAALAAVLLPFFKSGFEDKESSDLATSVFSSDIARGPVLIKSLENSLPIGTKLMSYAGAGYLYSALLYVPRSIAPFKGESTAKVFTAHVDSTSVTETDWGFGIGAIDELALNFGWLALLPGLFLYGCIFAMFDRWSVTVPVLKVATLLAAVWFMGYNSSALLNLFGAIALFGGLCHWAFTKQKHVVRVLVDNVVTKARRIGRHRSQIDSEAGTRNT